jgi:hypothetical protein
VAVSDSAPLGWLGHVCRAVGSLWRRDVREERAGYGVCGAADCAISERCGEGFEGIGDDGGAVEGAEFFGVGDVVEGIAEAVGDWAEAEVEGFEDGLAARMGALFHAAFLPALEFAGLNPFLNSILVAFLAEFLGEGHGCGTVGFGTDGFDFMEEGVIVNGVAAVHVADDEVEGVDENHGEEFFVPDRVAEEFAGTFGFEDTEGEDAVGGAADGIERDGGELDEFVEEVGEIAAHGVVWAGEAEERGKGRVDVPDAAVLCEDDGDDLWIGRAVVGDLFPAVPNADLVAEEAHGEAGIAGGLVFEEEVEGDVASVGFGGEEEVGFGEAEVRVDEGTGFEFKGAPVDAFGDLRWESVDEEGGGCGWVGEAGAEEAVVGVEGILVGHGGAGRIG